MAFGDFQLEIYLKGLSGVLPSMPMSFAELEARAQSAMSPSIWSYVAGGAGDERTQRVNVTAFETVSLHNDRHSYFLTLQAWAKKQRCGLITLAVFPGNTRALALYERNGFGPDLLRMARPL